MVLRDRYARVAALFCVVALGCAQGGVARLGDDAEVVDTNHDKKDAPPFDAKPPTDAEVDSMTPIDAMPPPDAPTTNPPFCLQNPDCVVPGTCCYFGTCEKGAAVGALCFPS
jgi:hypothetical protein